MYKAQEEQNIRNMTESREQQDLAGLGSQYNASKEGSAQALGSGLQSLAMLGQGLASQSKTDTTDTTEPTTAFKDAQKTKFEPIKYNTSGLFSLNK